MIIDCGATGNFIDPGLTASTKFPLQKLKWPIKAYNVDRTTNSKGNIVWETHVDLHFPRHWENIHLMVLNLGRKQIILGMPWLRKWNPVINWVTKQVTIPWPIGRRDGAPLHECLPSWTDSLVPQRYILWWLGMDANLKTACHFEKQKAWLAGEDIRKVTISTQIAQEPKPQDATLPNWCKDFEDVFSEKTHEQLPPHQPYNHVINLKPSFSPKIAKVYPLNPQEMETCKAFVEEHLKTGHIIPSKSPQVSPFFSVPKKDGTLRPCQDYWYPNSHTIRNAYPLPLIHELIDNMKDSTLFTKFDIRWGYNNIQLREEDQWKAAFITLLGLFEPMVMFFGFSNAPPTFQAFMNHICMDMIAEKWLKVYMDDMGIHTKDDLSLHHKRTRRVLQCLREHSLTVKLSKIIFDAPKMEFLDLIIGQGKVEMDKKKLKVIERWKPPMTVKGVWFFTGFANFYRKFIPNFSNIISPLNLLTRKGEPWAWTSLQQTTFNKLKQIFSSAPVLQIPDVTHLFSIMTDASLLAVGAILLQADTNQDLHPCTYFSRTFSPAQQNYDIYNRELLAVILALEEWRQYLQGTQHPIAIITDHKNLSYIKDPRKLSRRQARWSLFLQDFNIVWQVTPGTKMAPADTLSRKDAIDTSMDNAEKAIYPEPAVIGVLYLALARHIQASFSFDPLVLRAIENLCTDTPLFPRSSIKDWMYEGGHLYYKGRLYILPDAHHTLVSSLHSSPALGYAGQFHTKTFLKRDFWWPGLATYVNKFIEGCAVCQQNKVNTHPVCPPLNPIASTSTLPFKQLLVDLVTDLPETCRMDSILVLVDHSLMKGVIIIPCSKTIDTAGVGRLFFSHVFKRFGLHDSLISDQGLQFASALARELACLLKYNVKLSTAYHPQTDGQTECTNQEIETYLCIFCTNQPWNWPDLLPIAKFQHNSIPHHSTKVSPFSLMLGYEPWAYPSVGKTFLPTLENCLTTLEEARKEALAVHKLAQQIMREQLTRPFSLWKVGDKVWLDATNLRLQYPNRKLAPKRQGPFEISQVLSLIVYCLQLPPTWKIHDVFHASLLSPFRQTNTHGPSFSTPPPDLIGSEEKYKVETIISHKGCQYQVNSRTISGMSGD